MEPLPDRRLAQPERIGDVGDGHAAVVVHDQWQSIAHRQRRHGVAQSIELFGVHQLLARTELDRRGRERQQSIPAMPAAQAICGQAPDDSAQPGSHTLWPNPVAPLPRDHDRVVR